MRLALLALLAAGLVQYGLGVATLLLVVPVPLAAAHQAVATLLLTAAVLVLHATRPLPSARTIRVVKPSLTHHLTD